MDNPIVVEAKKYLDKVDFIVDLFDNSFTWGGEDILRLSEYTLEEFMQRRLFDTLDKSVDQEVIRKKLAEDIAKKHGETIVFCNTKAGTKVNLTMEFHVFEFDKGWYMAGKILKTERVA